ncbi:MAG TPA: hypothetical protein VKI65_16035 [Gemmataceae bacterium]|nr:hypothetical protein [Gemmataceae bacterium]
MIDRLDTPEDRAAAPPEAVPNGPPVPAEALEYRVRRLEDAVAGLQDTRELEDRVIERVARRIGRNAMQVVQDSAGMIVDARRMLPKAIGAVRPSATAPETPAPSKPAPVHHEWLLIDAYEEARAILHMYFDRGYRSHLTWTARVGPVILLLLILTSWWWVPGTSLLFFSLALMLDIFVNLLLAYLLYKVLSREARRYRDMFSG